MWYTCFQTYHRVDFLHIIYIYICTHIFIYIYIFLILGHFKPIVASIIFLHISLSIANASSFSTSSNLRLSLTRSTYRCLNLYLGQLLLGFYFVRFRIIWPSALHKFPNHFNFWLLSVVIILISLNGSINCLFENILQLPSPFVLAQIFFVRFFSQKLFNLFLSHLVDAHDLKANSTIGLTRVLYNFIFIFLNSLFDLNS